MLRGDVMTREDSQNFIMAAAVFKSFYARVHIFNKAFIGTLGISGGSVVALVEVLCTIKKKIYKKHKDSIDLLFGL